MNEIQGVIEEIIFHNEENGYVVAHINNNKEKTTIVGCIPYITEGQNLKLTGEWVTHPQFGQQFKIETCEEVLPNTITGIEKYLSSGIISGIGPVTAKKIVAHFGENTLEILDSDIERLSEIEGIGEKKIQLIYESYYKQREIKNIMIFLQTYGVTPNQCVKIHKKYGVQSIEKVKTNPFCLVDDISGIGFKTADKIARSLGVEINSPYRIKSGIVYVINEFCAMGNTYMPLDNLIKKAKEILKVKEKEITDNVYECALENKIKVEVIEKENCVFSLPYYYCELGVTKKIITLSVAKYDEVDIDVDAKITEFEEENNITFAQSQKEAIEGAFKNGIEVITGGPGTGKTTIINCITRIFEESGMTVLMAAPTGRASKRMTEATGREAKTIHRLLELGYGDEESMAFFRGEESPLECDVLIIDEASMIDIMLMNNLMKAVSVGTRVILVGDVDQLPSVGPGNVLKDVIESKCVKVVKLNQIFRQAQESMIVLNAHKINNGEMPVLNERGKDFFFINNENRENILNTILELVDKRLPKYNKKWDKTNHIQILTPMRKGNLGTYNLNKELQSILNPKKSGKKELEHRDFVFRVGDKVMQTKNNYNIKWVRTSGEGDREGIGVFNGDVGFVDDIDDDSVSVIFDNERRVVYEKMFLEELELAYAITIHKSQGSEFPVVIMPVFMGPPMLMSKNLFYTGITRAKQLVVLVGSKKAIHFMINNKKGFERYSALRWRISDVLDGDIFN